MIFKKLFENGWVAQFHYFLQPLSRIKYTKNYVNILFVKIYIKYYDKIKTWEFALLISLLSILL